MKKLKCLRCGENKTFERYVRYKCDSCLRNPNWYRKLL